MVENGEEIDGGVKSNADPETGGEEIEAECMYISRIIGLCSYKTLKEVSMSWDNMVGSRSFS